MPSNRAPAPAKPLRILVVEDSFMAARSLWTMLEDLGVEVLGPVPGVRAALELANASEFDGAVLDIELGNETSEAVATRLEQLGVPFMFISGYEAPQTMLRNESFRRRRLLTKPIEPAKLEQAIAEEFPSRPPRAAT